MFKTKAFIHSTEDIREITIKEQIGDNQYLVDYDGTLCVAMFNFLKGLYCVDDIYGVLPPIPETEWEKALQELNYFCNYNQRELDAYRNIGSVVSLRALKSKEVRKKEQRKKICLLVNNILLGFCAVITVWGLIYYFTVLAQA